jgi:hypothetical protein
VICNEIARSQGRDRWPSYSARTYGFSSLERTVCCSCSCVRRRWDSNWDRAQYSTLYTSVLVGPYYDLTWTHAAHDLLQVHHAERRVGLVLELHLVYSALLLLLLRRMTMIDYRLNPDTP